MVKKKGGRGVPLTHQNNQFPISLLFVFRCYIYFFAIFFLHLLITDILWSFPKHLENTMKHRFRNHLQPTDCVILREEWNSYRNKWQTIMNSQHPSS